MCVACHAPSRPPGRGLGLHGHGLRDRQLRGPRAVDAPAITIVLEVRRYRCTSCGAILTVVPRGVAPRRHYGHAAIALAFTLWAIVGASVAEVRRRVCAWPISTEAPQQWRAPRRWAHAARGALGLPTATAHAVAARAAQVAMGRAPPVLHGAPAAALAFAGGSLMP